MLMPALNNTDHDIGRLSEAVRLLQGAVEDLGSEVKSIKTTIDEAKGGWRVLMLLGGASAGVGAAFGAWFQHTIELVNRAPK